MQSKKMFKKIVDFIVYIHPFFEDRFRGDFIIHLQCLRVTMNGLPPPWTAAIFVEA
jgi:hypothetical protein